ncbi:tetratricopeptide repeat-containing sensor histidine kinase [Runella sp.]|uniref:tetratricopeptide repeat-containing sensor histidine kinase n=1 Tax=Runella sp. TaxID=1960881 RepID=UPI003D0A35AE
MTAHSLFFWVLITTLSSLLPVVNASNPLEKQPHTAQHDTTRIRIYCELAQHFRFQGKPDSSLLYVQKGLQLARKNGITTYHSELYRHWGLYFRSKGQFDKAAGILRKSWNWGWKHHQNTNIGKTGYALAVIYSGKSIATGLRANHIATIRQIYENLRFANHYNAKENLTSNYTLLAFLYQNYGNDSLGYAYLEKGQALFKKSLNNKQDSLSSLVNNIELNLFHKRPTAIEADFQEIMQFKGKDEMAFSYNSRLAELVLTYLKFKDFSHSFTLAQLITNNPAILASVNDESKMMAYCGLTEIYLHQHKYKEAQKAHEQTLYYAKNGARLWIKKRILINQEKILESQGRFREALALTKQIQSIQDSLSSAKYGFELTASQERFESELKEESLTQKIKIQELENQSKSQSLREAREIQTATFLIIFILAIVVVIIALQIRKIKTQASELKSLNDNKDRILGIIGHDLRTPVINLQLSLTDIIQHPPKNSGMLLENLAKQVPKVNNLLSSLDNLLYWSISQRDKITIHKRPVAIATGVEDVLEWLELSIEVKGIHIYKHIDENSMVTVDENHFRIILRNLLQNSLKFTPAGGNITLATQSINNTVQLIIQDTGAGFSKTLKESPQRGTQLGLKLVKDLMEANQSTVEIESQEGSGTTVRLIFPTMNANGSSAKFVEQL